MSRTSRVRLVNFPAAGYRQFNSYAAARYWTMQQSFEANIEEHGGRVIAVYSVLNGLIERYAQDA
jgi:hypothetical protein|tara:strand:+ start:418 stop:612 length:195 start_codon:yes stop_codon:yes gene_type:complete